MTGVCRLEIAPQLSAVVADDHVTFEVGHFQLQVGFIPICKALPEDIHRQMAVEHGVEPRDGKYRRHPGRIAGVKIGQLLPPLTVKISVIDGIELDSTLFPKFQDFLAIGVV